MPSNSFLTRFGFASGDGPPSALIFGSDLDAFNSVGVVLGQAHKTNARSRIFLCTTGDHEALAKKFPGELIAPLPFDSEPFVTLFLSLNRIRAVLVLENEADLPPALRTALHKRAAPISVANLRGATQQDVSTLVTSLFDSVGREREWDLRKDMRLRHALGRGLSTLMNNPKRRQQLKGFIERYDSITDLSEKLGNPETILCLGNGPSSEDARLDSIEYDALFRANHTWIGRGKFTDPDLIFTGLRAAMRKLKNPIIGVAHAGNERMLLAQRGVVPVTGKLKFLVHDKLVGGVQFPESDKHRPTSGAYLLSIAVSLQPKKLVIAGMDMFKHTDGAYPGEATQGNTYTPAHSFDHDLECLLTCLDQYQGELVIFSDVLRDEWDMHRKKRAAGPGVD